MSRSRRATVYHVAAVARFYVHLQRQQAWKGQTGRGEETGGGRQGQGQGRQTMRDKALRRAQGQARSGRASLAQGGQVGGGRRLGFAR